MANTFKKLRKKFRRRKMMAEKALLERKQNTASGTDHHQSRLLRRRIEALKRILTMTAIAVLAVLALVLYFQKHCYYDYKILKTSEQEDVVSTQYVELNGKILRYTPDGVSLVNRSLETVWSDIYKMQNPMADVRGERAVIADRDGTSMRIYGKDGLEGSVTTSYSIVKARISSNGLVAAILDGGGDTWINFYASDGSLIAENQTKIDDPGFPLDVAVSDDGQIMMVAYQFVDGGDTTSYVAFYNFGDVGQNEDDRIVSGYHYEGVVIPQIQYLSNSRSVALRDNGFTLYRGKQIPKETKTIEVEKEIVSTFYDDDTIGMVFKNDDSENLYSMEVYSADGKLKFRREFDVPYTTIRMSDGYIIMYNSSQVAVLEDDGTEKYNGTVEGTLNDFFKIGWNRYFMVLDTGVNIMKFS
ncbi:DUF5711 family protein [Blautia sp. HCP3S3_G3]|uniref:DUF5711 family protein n=1 Tax=Blautia sp. HCP3S3_G3 TaxID=3438913 RepID=UPI003F88A097